MHGQQNIKICHEVFKELRSIRRLGIKHPLPWLT